MKTGIDLLTDARLNKGSAFTLDERHELGLLGLLPPHVSTMKEQVQRVSENLAKQKDPIDKYVFLSLLVKRNERLFYRVLIDNIVELMPIVYTPTVGQACLEFAHIFRDTQGCYVAQHHKGNIKKVLGNWPAKDIRLIVVTDGERILGLGDLGTNGMGIPIGKVALYCACAGIHPSQCMAVTIDVGTNNNASLIDPLYLGTRKPRTRGEEYLSLIDEFITSVNELFPKALIQFEDFSSPNARTLLNHYQHKTLCFNDDIQGTAAVALAGLFASTRLTGVRLKDMRFLFVGAGSATSGIGELLVEALICEGLPLKEAYSRIRYIDHNGLLTAKRTDIPEVLRPFCVDSDSLTILDAVEQFKPHALLGATGSPGIFSEPVLNAMARHNLMPIIFALSNPTSRAECTALQAYEATEGRALFASGSPFGIVHYKGDIRIPGQGNNAYIFPGLGLGALSVSAKAITNNQLVAAARALSECVSDNQLQQGCLYPPLENIREVSALIAREVAQSILEDEKRSETLPDSYITDIQDSMYDPHY